jgi:hypothetical protein
MPDDGFAAFCASSNRRLLGQLFAVTGDLAAGAGQPGTGAGSVRVRP